MSLRRALPLAFVLLGVVPAVAVSWLSFNRTHAAMQARITGGLAEQARSLQVALDTMLFERFENALVWRESELMQDLRFGDVDKRVSGYLAGLAAGYRDVYGPLQAVDGAGRVIAGSRPQDIGRIVERPDRQRLSVQAALPGGQVRMFLAPPDAAGEDAALWIETELPAGPAAQAAPALLRLAFNPMQIQRLLDAAALGGRQVLVFDAGGRCVAASGGLRQAGRGCPGPEGLAFEAADDAASGRLHWRDSERPQLFGRAHSSASTAFAGSGWTTLVLQPADEALAPVTDIGRAFALVLGVVLLATFAAATLAATRILRPVKALTRITRRYEAEQRLPDAPWARSHIAELDELGQAYDAMIRSVERSRSELVRSAKLALLGEFAAVLAHEVRTPLGIVRSSAQVLRQDASLGAEGRELLGFIESETERLNRLVSTMLDTARPRRPRPVDCDLHEIAARCVQMRRVGSAEEAEHGATIELDLQAHDARLQADEEQLMQAIFNLVNNARQAAQPGGRVRVSSADAGDALLLRCEDDGPGIAPADAERLFEPFVTGRDGGFGLGLAVVRQIVEAHGGQVHVERASLGGAAFVVRLPRRAPQAAEAGA